ncbi:hypothetical protein [Criblamydia sequanensis]|nr:hypothetical protein [Criblamydia sequanensis]
MIVEGQPEKSGKVSYYQENYTLEYETSQVSSDRSLLLIYDTLTISFDEHTRKFLSFDAYTNKNEWLIKEHLKIPLSYKTGTLVVKEGYENTDRYSFKSIPAYEYLKGSILKISFQKEDLDTEFYLVSKDLIVGIRNHLISSMILLNLEV